MMLVWLCACGGSQAVGWLPADKTGGPTVQYDLTAEPLPKFRFRMIKQHALIQRLQREEDSISVKMLQLSMNAEHVAPSINWMVLELFTDHGHL